MIQVSHHKNHVDLITPSYKMNKNQNRDEIWKGYKKDKCNQKIYECRIHECMLNVRETES